MASEQEEGEGKGFKVVDRRRFDFAGEARTGPDVAPKEERKPVQAAAAQPPKAAVPPAAAVPEKEEELEGALTFPIFIQSLAQQAMMQLGMIPMPHSGQRELQLEAARDTIDVLSLMRTKTKGNLTAQEEQLLEGIIYELRMTYVQINQQLAAQAKAGGAAGGPGRKL
jgi:hypothetical protein